MLEPALSLVVEACSLDHALVHRLDRKRERERENGELHVNTVYTLQERPLKGGGIFLSLSFFLSACVVPLPWQTGVSPPPKEWESMSVK